MVIYSVFARWKTRRALARGVSLAALLGAVWFGLDRQLEGIGDLGRFAGAGLVAFPTALVDYGYRDREGQARPPRLLILLVFLLAWLSLIAIYLLPSTFVVLNQLADDPALGGRELACRIGLIGAPLSLPAAVVFALVTRVRWRRERFRGAYAQTAGTVTVLGALLGLGVLVTGQAPLIHPFHLLVTAPLLFAVLLPLVASGVDRVDGWLFPLPDDPTVARSAVGAAEEAASAVEEPGEPEPGAEEAASEQPIRRRIWDTGSSDRVFSWNRGGEEEEEEETATATREGPDSHELDAIADELWTE